MVTVKRNCNTFVTSTWQCVKCSSWWMCVWYEYIFCVKYIQKCIFISTSCSSICPHIYCYFSDLAVVISQNVSATYVVIQMLNNGCAGSCKYVYSYVQLCIWTAVYIRALSSCSEQRALACRNWASDFVAAVAGLNRSHVSSDVQNHDEELRGPGKYKWAGLKLGQEGRLRVLHGVNVHRVYYRARLWSFESWWPAGLKGLWHSNEKGCVSWSPYLFVTKLITLDNIRNC